jgi:predicted Zn-dependent protease
MSRREKLQQLLQDDPHDPFLHYALANEMLKDGETDPGIESLLSMIGKFPDYVAAYFRAAQALAESGTVDEARNIINTGIEVAGRVGDDHAAGEMREFRQMLDGEA